MAVGASLVASAAVNLPGGSGGALAAVGSISVVTDDIYLVFVHVNMWDDTTGVPTSIAGPGGLSFTNRGQSAAIDGYSKVSVWTAKATSSATGDIVVTAPGGSAWDGYIANVVKLTGVKTTGTNGADCIRTGQIASSVGAKPRTTTLASAMTAGNRALAFSGAYNNSATPETCAPTDWTTATELYDSGVALPDTGTYSMYSAAYLSADASDNSPTLNWTGTGAGAYGVIVVELDAAAGGGSTTTLDTTGASVTATPGSVSSRVTFAVSGASATAAPGNVSAAQRLATVGAAVSAASGSVAAAQRLAATGAAASAVAGAQALAQRLATIGATVNAISGSNRLALAWSVSGAAASLVPGSVSVSPGASLDAVTGAALTATPGDVVCRLRFVAAGALVSATPGVQAIRQTLATTGAALASSPGAVSVQQVYAIQVTGAVGVLVAGQCRVAQRLAVTGRQLTATPGGVTIAGADVAVVWSRARVLSRALGVTLETQAIAMSATIETRSLRAQLSAQLATRARVKKLTMRFEQ